MPDWLATLKDRATQLLIKYKGGALVTQFDMLKWDFFLSGAQGRSWGWPWMSSRRRGTREEFAFVTWKEVQFWCIWCFAFLFKGHPLRFAIGNTCIKSDPPFWAFPNYFSSFEKDGRGCPEVAQVNSNSVFYHTHTSLATLLPEAGDPTAQRIPAPPPRRSWNQVVVVEVSLLHRLLLQDPHQAVQHRAQWLVTFLVKVQHNHNIDTLPELEFSS